jgi:hypothetical protein
MMAMLASPDLVSYITCRICNDIIKDATSINECMHTCKLSFSFDWIGLMRGALRWTNGTVPLLNNQNKKQSVGVALRITLRS